MEELLPETRLTPMASTNPSSASTLRFLGLHRQPGSVPFTPTRNSDPFELQESDVVWSFAVSSDLHSYSNSTSHSPPSNDHRRCSFNLEKSVLPAALPDDHDNLVRRKSTLNHKKIPAVVRQEDVPAKLHQSAPVNIPLWPKDCHRKYRSGNLNKFDEVEDDDDCVVKGEEEMVPPHVIVARSHVTLSVFEGAGRTLKGRELFRVRNAVFQKTGFID